MSNNEVEVNLSEEEQVGAESGLTASIRPEVPTGSEGQGQDPPESIIKAGSKRKFNLTSLAKEVDPNAWQIEGDLGEYFDEQVRNFIPSKVLRDSITRENPTQKTWPKNRN